MKKILLAFLVATVAFQLNAQVLSISHESVDITNDTCFLSVPVDQLVDVYFEIHNLTTSTMSCHVQRYVDCEPTYFSHNWCFGVACYTDGTWGIDANILASDYKEFHIGPVPMTDGTTTNDKGYIYSYTFYPNSNPADSVRFWIANDPDGDCSLSSQSLVNASKTKANVFPNPADLTANLEYKVNSENAVLDIYNIIGEKVMSVKMESKEGILKINTSKLPSGTYIGTIVESGIKTKSIKLIVNH